MKTISRTVLAVLCTAALGVVASAAEAASTPEHGTAAAHFNGGRTLSLAMSGQSLVYGYSSGSVAFQGQVPCPPFAGGGNVTVSSSEGITPASAHWNGNDVAAFATSARMLADSGWAPNACASLHWTVTANVNVSNPAAPTVVGQTVTSNNTGVASGAFCWDGNLYVGDLNICYPLTDPAARIHWDLSY